MIGIAARWLLGRLSGLWRVICAHPWPFIVIALCALSWTLLQRGNRYRDDLIATLAAQQTAEQDQIAVNHEPARKSAGIAEKSNVDAKVYYEKGLRAGAAYVSANRVPASCAPRAADLPRTDSPAPVDDIPGQAADLVAVSREDFDTLTGNSLRLAKVQQDAAALIDEGVAVAAIEPAFGGAPR